MNNTQKIVLLKLREQLDGIRAHIEEIQSDEQNKLDNLPENFQGSNREEKFQEGIDALQDILDNIEYADNAFDNLDG
jgi:soluble cytochrome b562